ncbi:MULTISPECIES: DUF2922 domain-containing protein [unclassified Clostridioides]|uniref:DUF2922 domain-containing protein n=1 Tax=unclassified Clostridioides TaxID=2635829 RepID=UPI001D11DDB6|nr:DUF2922 domain-containing protein [Clostridioides sp. ZZV14-6154]MCC0669088.1 DUF2922 domain-containing protein [Clostridioides sp. ZZV14-6153]MCC0719470.1 DUF2922 domain-containing protein [Clostridioides sp. ZZV14-6105]MCC0723097.1 DUF2922 domain-containing protein [Clostridioides sp. ZZV14-6104]MCC0727291.1 DUF2922 domain-containing protein [Clostridioides sp. ZZV14-6045]MCC0731013.1 DUF2922 domain-containing protein [Clostridioides sp. ZZV14-6048]MCC0735454.1 DUF2922 domain-containing 
MEIKKKLVMSFKNVKDKQVSFSIENPKEDLTEENIKSVMDLIVSKNVFSVGGFDLASAVEAKIVETNTTPYDLVIR